MKRPYTGNKTGVATGVNPALTVFINQMIKRFPLLWDNGSFGVRMMRGSTESLSVHATGRAVDLSYRNMKDGKRGGEGGRKQAMLAADFAVTHATAIGLECILDYFPMPHGRGWRCDRDAWQIYKKPEIHGAPMGDWLHFEIDPKITVDEMRAALVIFDEA